MIHPHYEIMHPSEERIKGIPDNLKKHSYKMKIFEKQLLSIILWGCVGVYVYMCAWIYIKYRYKYTYRYMFIFIHEYTFYECRRYKHIKSLSYVTYM